MSDDTNPAQRFYFRVACVLGGLAVVTGAFGAHGIAQRVTAERLDVWHTAVAYQFYHAIAMLAFTTGILPVWSSSWSRWACRMWTLGVAVFSGSLYLLVLSDTGWLGAITPIGGVALILGWLCAARVALGKSA